MTVPPGYELNGTFDEAFAPDGGPRPGYGPVIEALSDAPLDSLAAAVQGSWPTGASPSATATPPFPVDPVPRVLRPRRLARAASDGLPQRVRALQAFAADAYGERRMVAAGLIPREVIETADHFEPWMLEVPMQARGATPGRRPGHRARLRRRAAGARGQRAHALGARLPVGGARGRVTRTSRWTRRRAGCDARRPSGWAPRSGLPPREAREKWSCSATGPPTAPGTSTASWRARLGIPLVLPGDVHLRGGRLHAVVDGSSRTVDVVYRRTDEDRLREPATGKPTWLAELLLEPLPRGRLRVVNGLGSGVADDKLVHAYVEEMVRFYLGEEPLIESVPTYDLTEPACRAEALDRLDELVVKPRSGHGGQGLVVGPHAHGQDVKAAARRIEEEPAGLGGAGDGEHLPPPDRRGAGAGAPPRGPALLRFERRG